MRVLKIRNKKKVPVINFVPSKWNYFAAAGILYVILMVLNVMAANRCRVTFRVSVRDLSPEDTVYIAGNQPELGGWYPGVTPLVKQPDGSWEIYFYFKKGTVLEYKFTLGTWAREALGTDGRTPPNSRFEVRDDTILTSYIPHWKKEQPDPAKGITGRVEYNRQMRGKGILPRDVVVWLPPGYNGHPEQRYPVLYMHDGQNILDPSTSFAGCDWRMDETADSLIRAGKLSPLIIVGIYNTRDRDQEYSDTTKGKAYMEFLIRTVKPWVDNNYRTLPEAEHTATMGSSMGGLISFLLAWNYPDVFHQAGCLSPAFLYQKYRSVNQVLQYKGKYKNIKFYIDDGSEGLEKQLLPGCERMISALQKNGYRNGSDYYWYYDTGGSHNEAAWSRRVWRALLFMFGTPAGKMELDDQVMIPASQ